MFDGRGSICAGLIMGKEGPELSLMGKSSEPRIELGLTKEGPCLSLRDEEGRLRFAAGAIVTATQSGKIIKYPESSLILFGPDGKVIWSAIN